MWQMKILKLKMPECYILSSCSKVYKKCNCCMNLPSLRLDEKINYGKGTILEQENKQWKEKVEKFKD